MANVLWIYLFCAVSRHVFAQQVLHCTDPDTGLRHYVNNSWPSTKSDGTYTCQEKTVLDRDGFPRIIAVIMKNSTVEKIEETPSGHLDEESETLSKTSQTNTKYRNEFPENFYDENKSEERPDFFKMKFQDFYEMSSGNKLDLNKKNTKESIQTGDIGKSSNKHHKTPHGDKNPQFYDYDGQLHEIRDDPLLLAIFKEYNKYLAKFLSFHPYSLYNFNNLHSSRKNRKEINQQDDGVASASSTLNVYDPQNSTTVTPEEYYNYWMKYYQNAFQDYKTNLQNLAKIGYTNPNYPYNLLPSNMNKNMEDVLTSASAINEKLSHKYQGKPTATTSYKNITKHKETLPEDKNKKNNISILYFDPSTGKYISEKPKEFSDYVKFYDEYMLYYDQLNPSPFSVPKTENTTPKPAIIETEPIVTVTIPTTTPSTTQSTTAISNSEERDRLVDTMRSWNNLGYSEDTSRLNANPYTVTQDLPKLSLDNYNKFDRINSKLALLGLPIMPRHFEIPTINPLLATKFRTPGFGTFQKRSVAYEDNGKSQKKTRIPRRVPRIPILFKLRGCRTCP